MNFSLLTDDELDEFLTQDYSGYNIFIDPDLTKVEQAESLFNQLEVYEDVEYPLPIIDLYLASQYQGSLNQRYTLDQLYNLTQDQIDEFAGVFNMAPPITIDRIIRILENLGLVINPKETFLDPGITDVICSRLSLTDLGNLMESMGEKSLTCTIQIDDPDRQISQVTNINVENIPYLKQIESDGSFKTVMRLINYYLPDQLEFLLSNRLNPNIRNRYTTALIEASDGVHLNIVELLLQYGADPNIKYQYATALINASSNYHSNIVESLLQFGADPNLQSLYKNTALIIASNMNRLNIAKLLLQSGADPNLQDHRGWAPLMSASNKGYLEMAELLLQSGADHNLQDDNGLTALILASNSGCLEIVELLLRSGADPNLQTGDGDGDTALISALSSNYLKDRLRIVELLLQYGADPNLQSPGGWTALMSASNSGHLEIVELLLRSGADPNLQTGDGHTALISASLRGHLEIVELLLRSGADLDLQDEDGDTALSVASLNGYAEIVELLLQHKGQS